MAYENSTADFPPEPNSVDCLLAVLADEQRRRVLRYFQAADDPVASRADLVDHLVEPESAPDAGVRERIRIQLHHCQLPRLADAGLLEYDSRTGHIQYHGNETAEGVMEYLLSRSNQIP